MARKTTCILMCAAVAALVLGVFPTTTLAQKGSRALDVLVPTTDVPGLPRLDRDTEPCENPSPPPPTLNIRLLGSSPFPVWSGDHWCITTDDALNLPLEFELDVSGLDPGGPDEQPIRGGQFFLEYRTDACSGPQPAFNYFGIEPGEPGPQGNPDQSPFQQEIAVWHTPPAGGNPGLLGYSIGIPFGQPMSACDNALATFTFTPTRQGKFVIWFRAPAINPRAMLTDDYGNVIAPPDLVLTQANEALALVVIVDWTPPVITCPADTTVECDQSTDPADTGEATATDNCDPAPVITYADVIVPGPCDDTYTIERTWTATDHCGNVIDCLQIIHVQDTTDPVITCPPAVTVECSDPLLPPDTGEATATDNCDPAPVITFADVIVPGSCDDSYTIERTWMATDRCGNDSDCLQVITVVDTTDPVITCPPAVTVECSDPLLPPYTGEATATDNCDPAPVITYADVIVPGPCDDTYTIERTWTATDRCGNAADCLQTITVVDTTDPTIVCPPDVTVECSDPLLPPDTGVATATDNCDPAPIIGYSDVMVPGSCDDSYTIERTWTATDRCGNGPVSCLQVITVVDTTDPVITCPPDMTVECHESTDPPLPVWPDVWDNCDPDPDITYVDVIVPGPCPDTYTIERTWTATDRCGNAADCLQLITVVDTTDPVITCPADVTVECSDPLLPPDTGEATATDNCDPAPVITYADVFVPGSCDDSYTIERTWTATDRCGNDADCLQLITVVDTTDPVITCPADVTVECSDPLLPPDTGIATATDNCDPTPAITYADVIVYGICDDDYTIERTWTATDRCGNAADCLQTITVVDTTDPTIVCPPDMTVECSDPLLPPDTGVATATDNCDPAPVITYVDVIVPGLCDDSYTIERTWTATDRCGNDSDCLQVITVTDTTPPEPYNCQDIVLDPYYVDPGDPCETRPQDQPQLPCEAIDNCDPAPDLVCERDDGLDCFNDPYPCGMTTLTWTATDRCGNSASWTTTVTVNAYTEMTVEVQLQAVYANVTRAIEFELFTCDVNASTCGQADPYVVCEEIVFTSSGVPNSAIGGATLTVPCGQYDCITARDPLHTLRRTLTPIPDNGTTYVAAFTAANGKDLIGGNLDGNDWVDIVDYGLFAGQWNTFPAANTSCPAAYPPAHADFSGNARVWTEDYTFIQLHMWWESELNCCGLPFNGDSDGPIEAISVQELRDSGMSEAAAGDLNGDGWLDVQDLEEWARGTRPQPPTPNQQKGGLSPQRP